jgi:hypothetical protein
MLERGTIASTENDRCEALVLLEQAARLNPRDPLTRQALRLAREGKRVSVEDLNPLNPAQRSTTCVKKPYFFAEYRSHCSTWPPTFASL